MFQIASVYGMSKSTGHSFGIFEIPLPPKQHSSLDYAASILSPATFFLTPTLSTVRVSEDRAAPIDMSMLTPNRVYLMDGYFQHAMYIEPWKQDALKLFDVRPRTIEDAYFLHVRRGDFVNHRYHEMDLSRYYVSAVSKMGHGVAHVVSNDVGYCESWSFLDDVRHTIVQENELDTLAIMAGCDKGGIAANSSFSWWGLYLNTDRPNLILPNRFFPHDELYDNRRYHFQGSTVLEV